MAARRAEVEAAKQRELELQCQLEAMNDDSSSDEGPKQITPQASTPTLGGSQMGQQEPERKPSSPPVAASITSLPPPAVVKPPPSEAKSKNPYFKMMSHLSEATSPAVAKGTVAAPAAPPQPDPSTNPFHRMTQENKAAATPTGPITRKRADSDDWGSSKDDDSDDSDDDRPGGGSAAQLASILFGTMAPPRPLSAAGKESAPTSPAPVNDAPVAPPPPPPVLSSDGRAAPPPPPPPPPGDAPALPSSGGGRPAGFMSEIQMGKALKRTTTKDKSGAAVAGRVLD